MSEPAAKRPEASAYQRWEMKPLAPARSDKPAAPASISKLAQEMVAARDAGHQQGYQDGLAQGRAEGQAQGLAQGLEQAASVLAGHQAALDELCRHFQEQAKLAREQTAQHMLALALDMAHALFKSTLELQPERVLPVIEQALRELPGLQASASLYLNPQDLELVRASQGATAITTGLRLCADAQLARGGCRLETAENEIDARVETRWRRLQQAFDLAPEDLTPL